MNRKQTFNIISLISIVILGVLLFSFFKSMKKPPETALPTQADRFVKTKLVTYSNLPGKLESNGRLRAFNEIQISSEVTGRLAEGTRLFKAGMSFSAGEIIARVQNDEFEYQVRAQKSKFMQSIATILADLKIDYAASYDEWVTFFEKINVSKPLPSLPQINNSKERIFLASRNVLNDYYTIKSNESRLEKHIIRAPFNGSLKEVSTQVGSVVNIGSRLGTFTRSDLFELEVPIGAESIDIMKTGTRVIIKNKEGNANWTGTVSRIAAVINESTQSISIYITIPNNSQIPLYDGMYLSASLLGEEINQVIEIPRNALFNNNFVYLLIDNKLIKKEVNKVLTNTETVYINGLEEGQLVVTEPIVGITDYLIFKPLQ